MLEYISTLIVFLVSHLPLGTEAVPTEVSTLPQITCNYDPMIGCKTGQENKICIYDVLDPKEFSCFADTKITLNETHPHFRFSKNPEEGPVVLLTFNGLTMHTFTNDTCVTFPSLEKLYVDSVGLQVILQNSLQFCTDLRSVSFNDNQLLLISSWTFTRNIKIEEISLSNNTIKTIEPNAFDNLENLVNLNLMNNQLKQFPGESELPLMNKLLTMSLSSKYLEEIDGKEILRKCPNLQLLILCENNFISEAYIKQQLVQRNVSVFGFEPIKCWYKLQ